MPFYRKLPVVIEAVQWGGVLDEETVAWCGGELDYDEDGDVFLSIETLEGAHGARPLDWVIKGIKGEFYPCKPDIFEATYEPAPGWQHNHEVRA